MFAKTPEIASRQPQKRHATPADPGVKARLGRFLATGLVAGLALLHSQLLWQRIANFTLFEPLVALRWSAAALLVAGFVYLQRTGVSVIWGHKAMILWLLVLLCHAGTALPIEGHQLLAEPGLLVAISLSGLALRAILGDLADLLGGRIPYAARIMPPRHPPCLPCGTRFLEPLSPRPPPIA